MNTTIGDRERGAKATPRSIATLGRVSDGHLLFGSIRVLDGAASVSLASTSFWGRSGGSQCV
jgi:hypothetical protein